MHGSPFYRPKVTPSVEAVKLMKEQLTPLHRIPKTVPAGGRGYNHRITDPPHDAVADGWRVSCTKYHGDGYVPHAELVAAVKRWRRTHRTTVIPFSPVDRG
jgi:hypothetical protein